MPLPSVASGHAKQCEAICRSRGERCKNPAAFGMRTCRYHGARRATTVLRGEDHPQFRHGLDTTEAKALRAAKLKELWSMFAAVRSN